MAGAIGLTPSEIHGHAGRYRDYANQWQEVISGMAVVKDTIRDTAKGDTPVAIENKFMELKNSFDKTVEVINQFAQGLDAYADNMSSADQGSAKYFG